MRIIELELFPVPVRLHSDTGKMNLAIISLYFAIFKNVVHSLEPGETPSNSASHQAPDYVQRSYITQYTLKRCVAVALRCVYFFNLFKTRTVIHY